MIQIYVSYDSSYLDLDSGMFAFDWFPCCTTLSLGGDWTTEISLAELSCNHAVCIRYRLLSGNKVIDTFEAEQLEDIRRKKQKKNVPPQKCNSVSPKSVIVVRLTVKHYTLWCYLLAEVKSWRKKQRGRAKWLRQTPLQVSIPSKHNAALQKSVSQMFYEVGMHSVHFRVCVYVIMLT